MHVAAPSELDAIGFCMLPRRNFAELQVEFVWEERGRLRGEFRLRGEVT